MEVFDHLNVEGHTIIVVTHEEHIAKHSHRIVRLRDGQVEEDILLSKNGYPIESDTDPSAE